MEKTMEPLVVRTKEGKIEILQQIGFDGAEQCIELLPEQIDILIGWLHEARDEIRGAG